MPLGTAAQSLGTATLPGNPQREFERRFICINKIINKLFSHLISLTQILVEDSLEELLFLATALLFLAALGVSPSNLIKP
ncbi:hypothetical protein BpHYR1_018154 [Brachionus plicatilis]|uniref:Uncharacterized protein n=1 Tax=Brachionus plicatilis TaxID=10195 RepID=A0A3M7QD91_BRAPC|nr:hypothetical protein BpHYR1_018154 [Brachionus plicatilis]